MTKEELQAAVEEIRVFVGMGMDQAYAQEDEALMKRGLEARRLLVVLQKLAERTQPAIDLAVRYGGIDGAHHKTWVIDQMVRVLAGDGYADVVREAKAGEDGPDTYGWDEGIAP